MNEKGKVTKRELFIELQGAKYLKEELSKMFIKLHNRHRKVVDAHRTTILEQCGNFKSIEEAEDAYGWGYISKQEFQTIKEYFKQGDIALDEETKWSIAAGYLHFFYNSMCNSVRELEYEMLSPEEKKQYQKDAEEFKKHTDIISNAAQKILKGETDDTLG